MIVIMLGNFIDQLAARAGRLRDIDKGSYLFHEGDRVKSVFVVERGLVELGRPQLDGASIILQRASDRAVLAEASLYSSTYHCDALAVLPSSVFEISKSCFLTQIREDWQFSQLWATHLAREVQAARSRCEILARKTVAERLDGWLAWHENKLPDKGQWRSLAEQLGVSPEALYRELAKRRNQINTA